MEAETHQLLKSLHLAKMLEILDEELEQARAKDPTHQEFLVRLLRAQWHYRQEKALDWRIKRAKLPFTWTLESFPFKKQPGVSRRRIKNFASLEFVPRAENIVFMGKTGVERPAWPPAWCSRRYRTAIGPCSSERRNSSTRCTPHWPTALLRSTSEC